MTRLHNALARQKLWRPNPKRRLYAPRAAAFGGASDYIHAGGLTTADATELALNVWFRVGGGDGTARVMIGATGFRVYAQLGTGNQLILACRNSANSNILVHTGTATYTDDAWHHLFAKMKPDGAGSSFVFEDGVETTNLSTDTAGTIHSSVTSWTVGAFDNTSGRWNGSLADLWLGNPGREIVRADVSRFIASGRPRKLGEGGRAPFGVRPMFFFSGAGAAFASNRGSAGAMAIAGSLDAGQLPVRLAA